MTQSDCLFCRIVAGEIPAKVLYRNEHVTAFHDIDPKAPTHVLIVPNTHITNMNHVGDEQVAEVGQVMRAAPEVAQAAGVAASGYRLVVNTGEDALNTVPHLHVHLLGGRKMTWPPG